MVSFQILKNRKFRLILMFIGCMNVAIIASVMEANHLYQHRLNATLLHIQKANTIPLREISGMAMAPPSQNSHPSLYLVGDKYAQIVVADLVEGEVIEKQRLDFSKAITKHFSVCDSWEIIDCKNINAILTSQWEAIALDARKNIYLLHEKLASIFILNPQANSIKAVINLERFSEHPHSVKSKKEKSHENKLGEGLVLLSNGHVLVAKQKRPVSIIEFGLEQERPQGMHPKLLLSSSDKKEFPLKAGQSKLKFIPLKVWKMPEDLSHCDLNELTTDSAGGLYFVSEKCHLIGKLENLKVEEREFKIQKSWLLPDRLAPAEGLVILGDGKFLIGLDKKSIDKPNVFFLQ